MKNDDDDAFVFAGDSFAEWAARLDQLENAVTPGDGFAFSVAGIGLAEEFLRRLRCLNLAEFEIAERPTEDFRKEVVVPLLTPDERRSILSTESLRSFFRRTWRLSGAECEAVSIISVILRSLMRKQTGQTVNSRLHQAFDFVAFFYDIYYLEYSECLFHSKEPFSEQFAGLFDRYHQETNEWIRFAMGYVLVDFIGSRKLLFETQIKTQVQEVFSDYAHLLKKWTGAVWNEMEI